MIQLLDSAAVMNNPGFSFSSEHCFITAPAIVDEFKDMRSRNLADNALRNGLLILQEPSNESAGKIRQLAEKHGFSRLSKADVSLLALALDLKKQRKKFVLLTDDYSVQNFCKLLKIKFDSVIRGKIEKTISFKKLCRGCGRQFPTNFPKKNCPDCGAEIASESNR